MPALSQKFVPMSDFQAYVFVLALCPLLLVGPQTTVLPRTCAEQDSAVGTVCTLQCAAGYSLSSVIESSVALTCLQTGLWDRDVVACIAEVF